MSRKWWAVIVVAVLAAAAVTVGIATSMAQGTTTLQSLSVAQLLAKVGDASKSTTAVSGDITWTNGLIPGSDLTGLLSGQSSAPSSLSGLALGGSGRIWLQQGSGLRLESQGSGSDFVVVAGKNGLWSYSSATSTATHYAPPAGAMTTPSPSPSPQLSSTDPLAAITAGLQRFASTGTVTMGPQTTVAGQPSYLLVMTPASAHTTVGSVQVAVDAKTFVPLRVQVFAKGGTTAILSAGFTSVSYGHLGSSLFAFTPPAGATVRSQALPSPQGLLGGAAATEPAAHKPLTLAAAKAKAAGYGLTLAMPSTPPGDLSFTGATVVAPSGSRGATAVLHYGSGFGSVVLIESQGASSQTAGLQQQIASLPHGLITATMVAGGPGYELQTPLVTIAAWQHGTTTAVAAGFVPPTLFSQFLAAIH
jgi:outer membrane lipoprotein-sorting protein